MGLYISGIVILITMATLASCKKNACNEPISPCKSDCNLEPMMGFCGTMAVYKFHFNKTTRQCEEYIHVGDVIPFETLAECQSCDCEKHTN